MYEPLQLVPHRPPTFSCAPTGCSLSAFSAVLLPLFTGCRANSSPLIRRTDVSQRERRFSGTIYHCTVPQVRDVWRIPGSLQVDIDHTASEDSKSYQPISNLPVLLKTLERLVALASSWTTSIFKATRPWSEGPLYFTSELFLPRTVIAARRRSGAPSKVFK